MTNIARRAQRWSFSISEFSIYVCNEAFKPCNDPLRQTASDPRSKPCIGWLARKVVLPSSIIRAGLWNHDTMSLRA